MPEPYNYAGSFPQVDFSQALLSGLQGGMALRAQQEQQALQKEAMQLKIQQAQQAMQQQQSQQDALRQFSQIQDPTSKDYSNLMLAMPQMAEHLQKAWAIQDADQKDRKFGQVAQVYTALQNKRPDVAKEILSKQADMYDAAGQADQAKAYRTIADTIDIDPKGAQLFAYANLHAADSKRATELVDSLGKISQQPYETSIKQSEAITKAAQAGVAPETEAMKIRAAQTEEEAKRQQMRINAMDAELRKAEGLLKIEESPLRREQLQLQVNELRTKIGDEQRDKVATAKTVLDGFGQSSGKIQELLNHPGFNSLSGILGEKHIPGTEGANAQALLDVVKSSSFISSLMSFKQAGGTLGAVSDAEGKKFDNAVEAVVQSQDSKQLRQSLMNLQSFMNNKINISLERSANLPVIDSPTRGKITGQKVIDAARKAKVKPWEMYQFLNKEANQ